MKLFIAPKSSQRSWKEIFLFLTAVSDVSGDEENHVLNNMVHYADTTMHGKDLIVTWEKDTCCLLFAFKGCDAHDDVVRFGPE
ncbi:unnamed protein product [Albugo candida]|uniref:Uncharacterized protein n=1 Tax=Albugo candida TaxID=65357 RepID=A0A024GPR5_9STRA|nr:unnamed protein product [Albugo candida]|eukprot:CCI48344.1 unnamed protein product [Albugo candida]